MTENKRDDVKCKFGCAIMEGHVQYFIFCYQAT